jgi:hypothetical protein
MCAWLFRQAVSAGDLVVHSLIPKARAHYDLERLWRDGKLVEIPPETPVETQVAPKVKRAKKSA